MKLPIYLDNHSTTAVDPRVLSEMQPYFTERFGNAASRQHAFGWAAEQAVERARQQIAKLINADPKEIVFTSGATESDNLALLGVAEAYRERGKHIITCVTEHHAVSDAAQHLVAAGSEVTFLPVDRYGRIDLAGFQAAITPRTILISIMAANNEIGTLQPIAEIGKIAKGRGILFHTDAAQALGKIPLDVQSMGVDLMSLSAHKMYGPKGIGALYVRNKKPRVSLEPLFYGGGHERGLRPGTLNVPAIVGFGKACELAGQEMKTERERLLRLRDKLWTGLQKEFSDIQLNGHPTERLPGNLNVSLASIAADALMAKCSGLALSSGSACTSATAEPSYVLRALGVTDERAKGAIRFGLGRFTTGQEIEDALGQLVAAVKKLRAAVFSE